MQKVSILFARAVIQEMNSLSSQDITFLEAGISQDAEENEYADA